MFYTERDHDYFLGSGKNLTFPKYQSSQYGHIMNNKKTNQDRINELKQKIFYAEAARDNYREARVILYETNSFGSCYV